MRRFTLVAVVLCLFLALFGWMEKGEAYDIKMAIVTNETAARTDTQISITTAIIPGKCRVLGFKITPYGADCVDPYVELHDVATTGAISGSTTMFDLLEADTNPLRSETEWYPTPKRISNGVAVRLGGYTAVVVYYEQYLQ